MNPVGADHPVGKTDQVSSSHPEIEVPVLKNPLLIISSNYIENTATNHQHRTRNRPVENKLTSDPRICPEMAYICMMKFGQSAVGNQFPITIDNDTISKNGHFIRIFVEILYSLNIPPGRR